MPEAIFDPGKSRNCWRPWDSTANNWPTISSTVPRHLAHRHPLRRHPRLHEEDREDEVQPRAEVEVGGVAGCHPVGAAGMTMAARPGAAGVAMEADAVAVAVDEGVAAGPPLDEGA